MQKQIKTFVLNLEKKKYKYEILKKKLDDLGIDHERFVAIDGTEHTELFKKKKFGKEVYNGNIFDKSGLFRSYGAFGCLLSYIEIFKLSIKKNYEYIFLLQDDIWFHKDFKNMYKKFLSYDFDALYLGSTIFGKKSNKELSNIIKNTCGLYGIILHKNTFSKILETMESFKFPADVCVCNVLKKEFEETSFICYPKLIIADRTSSTTCHDKHKEDHKKFYRIQKIDLKNYDMTYNFN